MNSQSVPDLTPAEKQALFQGNGSKVGVSYRGETETALPSPDFSGPNTAKQILHKMTPQNNILANTKLAFKHYD